MPNELDNLHLMDNNMKPLSKYLIIAILVFAVLIISLNIIVNFFNF
ncbi:hypothetical protein [Mangrovimonas yunxiaonensis]|nr:hypothetical protein [Mangrovimonas yunxiaonensis]